METSQDHPQLAVTEEDFDKLGFDLPKPPYLEHILRSVAEAPVMSEARLQTIRSIIQSGATTPSTQGG